jgi:hypothetical protein
VTSAIEQTLRPALNRAGDWVTHMINIERAKGAIRR